MHVTVYRRGKGTRLNATSLAAKTYILPDPFV
jgi:hypothetical protein